MYIYMTKFNIAINTVTELFTQNSVIGETNKSKHLIGVITCKIHKSTFETELALKIKSNI